MRLGIDLGTTRTLVAVADRGNFPLVSFVDDAGDSADYFPSTIAERRGKLLFGFEAEQAAREGAPVLRSFKRLLSIQRPLELVRVGDVETDLLALTTGFLTALHENLLQSSNLPGRDHAELDAVISVPANAHSGQRFATIEAFRRAGFGVRGVLNEPSAAGMEYAHRHADTINKRREHVAIYDLGGGTFDAALVLLREGQHDVVASHGISRLGGDDFDGALLDLALERLGPELVPSALPPACRARLLLEARELKESISPSTKRVVLELAALGDLAPDTPVIIDVASYFERVAPLVERSLEALSAVLVDESGAARESDLAGVYVVGGASALPLVPRLLRERFGRRLHRSPHPAGAVAIGLSIVAALEAPPLVRDVLTRYVGVFRERDAGSEVSFDGILEKGTVLPDDGERLSVRRRYRAAHNLGHFRFLECGDLDAGGGPAGDITPHGQILFPFSTELVGSDLTQIPVERLSSEGPLIEEHYQLDATGVIEVTIENLEAGYSQSYVL